MYQNSNSPCLVDLRRLLVSQTHDVRGKTTKKACTLFQKISKPLLVWSSVYEVLAASACRSPKGYLHWHFLDYLHLTVEFFALFAEFFCRSSIPAKRMQQSRPSQALPTIWWDVVGLVVYPKSPPVTYGVFERQPRESTKTQLHVPSFQAIQQSASLAVLHWSPFLEANHFPSLESAKSPG